MRREEREQAALAWVRPYRLSDHLVRTRDWVLELEPEASEALVLAALTHDIERHFPGGPRFDPSAQSPDDFEYRWQHSMRSAQFVHEWLYRHGGTDELVFEIETLILLHELGGDHHANILQAADSLSFLETLTPLTISWVQSGRAIPERAKVKISSSLDRIAPSLERARELAGPMLAKALQQLDAASAEASAR